jgi:hypothetical protein
MSARFIVTQVAITAFDGDRWPTLQILALTGRETPEATGTPGKS